jgi:hypothetical protein
MIIENIVEIILGIHEGVIAKLRKYLATDCLELNACVAHSFALVGSQSAYIPKMQSIHCFLHHKLSD